MCGGRFGRLEVETTSQQSHGGLCNPGSAGSDWDAIGRSGRAVRRMKSEQWAALAVCAPSEEFLTPHPEKMLLRSG